MCGFVYSLYGMVSSANMFDYNLSLGAFGVKWKGHGTGKQDWVLVQVTSSVGQASS